MGSGTSLFLLHPWSEDSTRGIVQKRHSFSFSMKPFPGLRISPDSPLRAAASLWCRPPGPCLWIFSPLQEGDFDFDLLAPLALYVSVGILWVSNNDDVTVNPSSSGRTCTSSLVQSGDQGWGKPRDLRACLRCSVSTMQHDSEETCSA